MTETTSEHAGDDAHRVELATLILPTAALETGIAGEVVLQASSETVANIIQESEKNSGELLPSTVCAGIGSTNTQIQAVVDLEKLSELAGVSEDEFVSGLHREANEQYPEQESVEHPDLENAGEISLHDVAPEKVYGTSASKSEQQPLVAPSHRRQNTADCVSLSMDPFAETLADTLISSDINNDANDLVARGTVTVTTEEDKHLPHDAFLLEIPESPGGREQHFVLALPEIIIPQDAISNTSESGLSLLQRTFSMLPTDVEDVQLEATTVTIATGKIEGETTTDIHLDLVVSRRVPVIGYVLLVLALFALSSVGAAFDMQLGGVRPLMKAFWRMSATALALLPLAVRSLRRDGRPVLSASQLRLFPLCSFGYVVMVAAFVTALSLTSLASVFVLSNMSCLVIIAARGVMGLPVLAAEGVGATIGFLGGIICAGGKSSGGEEAGGGGVEEDFHPVTGDVVAFLASVGASVYLVIAKEFRSSVDLFVFMFALMTMGSLLLLAFMLVCGENVTFSNHPAHGLWGWTNLAPDRLPLEIYIVVVCNLIGTTGYVAVMKYFEPVVVSTVMLMEPVAAALMGAAVGVDSLPGAQLWLGDVLVCIGSFLVIRSGARSTEAIDATAALRSNVHEVDNHTSVTTLMNSPIPTKKPLHRRVHSDFAKPIVQNGGHGGSRLRADSDFAKPGNGHVRPRLQKKISFNTKFRSNQD